MKYFSLIGMTILFMSACEFVQENPLEPTVIPISVVEIDSVEMLDMFVEVDENNPLQWEIDYLRKSTDFGELGAFTVDKIMPREWENNCGYSNSCAGTLKISQSKQDKELTKHFV